MMIYTRTYDFNSDYAFLFGRNTCTYINYKPQSHIRARVV